MGVPARVLDFWQAYDRLEPIGDSWMQSAMICQQLSTGHGYQLASVGVKHEPKSFTDFMPSQYRKPRKAASRGKGINPTVLRSRLEARFKV